MNALCDLFWIPDIGVQRIGELGMLREHFWSTSRF